MLNVILFSAENVNFKFIGTFQLKDVCLSKYQRNSKGAVLCTAKFILGIWIYANMFQNTVPFMF